MAKASNSNTPTAVPVHRARHTASTRRRPVRSWSRCPGFNVGTDTVDAPGVAGIGGVCERHHHITERQDVRAAQRRPRSAGVDQIQSPATCRTPWPSRRFEGISVPPPTISWLLPTSDSNSGLVLTFAAGDVAKQRTPVSSAFASASSSAISGAPCSASKWITPATSRDLRADAVPNHPCELYVTGIGVLATSYSSSRSHTDVRAAVLEQRNGRAARPPSDSRAPAARIEAEQLGQSRSHRRAGSRPRSSCFGQPGGTITITRRRRQPTQNDGRDGCGDAAVGSDPPSAQTLNYSGSARLPNEKVSELDAEDGQRSWINGRGKTEAYAHRDLHRHAGAPALRRPP